MKKKVLAGVLALCLASGCLVGCGGGEIDLSWDRTVSDKRISYTIYAPDLAAMESRTKDRIIQFLDDKFNVDLHFAGAAYADYSSTLNTKMGSGEIPDLFFAQPTTAEYRRWVNDGMILPISAVFDEMPNVKSIYEANYFKDLSIDGQYWFTPQITDLQANYLLYRKDWLDKTDIEIREENGEQVLTLDEFERILEAFSDDEIDGNAATQNYGMSPSKFFSTISPLYAAFGVLPGWQTYGSNTYQHMLFNQNFYDFLAWYEEMYQNGYIYGDWFTNTEEKAKEDFYSGKSGVFFVNGEWSISDAVTGLAAAQPGAQIGILPFPTGDDGNSGTINYRLFGGWNVAYSAEEPIRLARILDYLYSPEGQLLRYMGIEGYHYSVSADGELIPNIANRTADGGVTRWRGSVTGNVDGFYKIANLWGEFYRIEETAAGKEVVCYRPFAGTDPANAYYGFTTEPILVMEMDELLRKNSLSPEKSLILDFSLELKRIESSLNSVGETWATKIATGNAGGYETGLAAMKRDAETAKYSYAQQLVKEFMEQFK